MNRPNRVKLFLFIITSSLWAGCESNPFVPPRPPELDVKPAGGTYKTEDIRPSGATKTDLSGPTGQSLLSESTANPRIKGIELILMRPETIDREYLTQIVRKEAGKRKLTFRLTKPELGEPMSAARVAQAIRKAADLRYAVILEPLDAAEVCDALQSFQSTGLGMLLLDQPLSCPGQAISTHTVQFTGFFDRGEAIVRAALEETVGEVSPGNGPITVLRNRSIDAYTNQRRKSLTDALEKRKLPFDIVEFEGSESEAHLRLMAHLKTHNKRPIIVLAEDHRGLLGGFRAHEELTKERQPAFILAGYALMDIRTGFPGHIACVGFAYQDLDDYSRKAAEIVINISNGKTVPLTYESELPFVRTRSAVKSGTGAGESRPK